MGKTAGYSFLKSFKRILDFTTLLRCKPDRFLNTWHPTHIDPTIPGITCMNRLDQGTTRNAKEQDDNAN